MKMDSLVAKCKRGLQLWNIIRKFLHKKFQMTMLIPAANSTNPNCKQTQEQEAVHCYWVMVISKYMYSVHAGVHNITIMVLSLIPP